MKESLEELQAWAKKQGASLAEDTEKIALERRLRRLGLDPRLVLRAGEMDSLAAFKRVKEELAGAA